MFKPALYAVKSSGSTFSSRIHQLNIYPQNWIFIDPFPSVKTLIEKYHIPFTANFLHQYVTKMYGQSNLARCSLFEHYEISLIFQSGNIFCQTSH